MSFFEPGDASQTTKTTPSPADQAKQKFQTEMLGRFLDAMAGTAPSFKSFVQGGSPQRQFPGGFDAGIGQLLQAMSQPGAFTSTSTGTGHGVTPSGLSDLMQLGVLGLLGNQLTGGALSSGIGSILAPLGGALGIGGVNTALGDTTANLPFSMNTLPSDAAVPPEGTFDSGFLADLGLLGY